LRKRNKGNGSAASYTTLSRRTCVTLKQLQIFRIVQEALTSIEKHAGACEVIVTMCTENGKGLYIGISDDGKGFISPFKKGVPDEKTPHCSAETLK